MNAEEQPQPGAGAGPLARLRAHLPSLSPAERKVAICILEGYQAVIRMSLEEVARRSGVSDTTALRFCHDIGYEGWLEFKIAVTQSLPRTPDLILDGSTAEDSPGQLARKVLQSSQRAIEDTLAFLDDDRFAAAVEMLATARWVLIVAVGTSGPPAQEMFNRLFRLRIPVHVQTDSALQVMQAALVREGDVVVAISHSGSSYPPLSAVKEAKLHGARVIAITGDMLSPLSQEADIVLLAVSHELRSEALASRIAEHALIHALYVAVASRSLEAAAEAEELIWAGLLRARSGRRAAER